MVAVTFEGRGWRVDELKADSEPKRVIPVIRVYRGDKLISEREIEPYDSYLITESEGFSVYLDFDYDTND